MAEEQASALRKQLEETLGKLKQYESTTAEVVASAHKYVKPEDLIGIDPSLLMERASAIEATRIEEREQIFEEMAVERGLSTIAEQQTQPAASDAASRFSSLGSLTGGPLKLPEPGEGKTGVQRIAAVIEARRTPKRR